MKAKYTKQEDKRVASLERKVTEIDENIVRLLYLLKEDNIKEGANGKSPNVSSSVSRAVSKGRRLRGRTVPTSARAASLAPASQNAASD